jgi:hypothetical protein
MHDMPRMSLAESTKSMRLTLPSRSRQKAPMAVGKRNQYFNLLAQNSIPREGAYSPIRIAAIRFVEW